MKKQSKKVVWKDLNPFIEFLKKNYDTVLFPKGSFDRTDMIKIKENYLNQL